MKSERTKAAQLRYNLSEKGKLSRQKYLSSDKGKKAQKRYYDSEKAHLKRDQDKLRAELMRNIQIFLENNPGKTIENYLEELKDA